MTTSRVASLVLLSALACKTEGSAGAGKCDQAGLASLADALDAAPADAGPGIVAPRLVAACPGLVPPIVEHYLREGVVRSREVARLPPADDGSFVEAKRLACAGIDGLDAKLVDAPPSEQAAIAFDTCDYQRFEVISREQASAASGLSWMTWTTHALLIGDGTPPRVASSITRAMWMFEESGMALVHIAALPGQQLPLAAVRTPVPDGIVIQASLTSLVVDDRELLTLEAGKFAAGDLAGHVVPSLAERLAEATAPQREMAEARGEDELDARVLLMFDARVPATTMIDVMHTAMMREGIRKFGLVGESYPTITRAILIDNQRIEGARRLEVAIEADGYRVDGVPAPDLARVAELAKQAGGETFGVVIPQPSTPMANVVATFAALLGPDCIQGVSGCLVSAVILEAAAD